LGRRGLMDAPEVVMRQLDGRGALKAGDDAPLRIDAGEDFLDRAVLTAAVHRLEDDEERVAGLGVKLVLKLPELLEVLLSLSVGGFPVGEFAGVVRRMVVDLEFLSGFDEVRGFDHALILPEARARAGAIGERAVARVPDRDDFEPVEGAADPRSWPAKP